MLTVVFQFPGGLVDRWKQMAAFIGLFQHPWPFETLVHFAVAGTRTPEEVVAKVKTFRAQDSSGLMSTVKSDLSAKAAPSSAAAPAAAPSAAPKSSPSLSAAAAPNDVSVAAACEEDDWTSSEQKALEGPVPLCSCPVSNV